MLREQIEIALQEATKSQDKIRRSTLRLVMAAIKDKQIQLRTEQDSDDLSDQDITQLLARMVKQRRDSAEAFEKGDRKDLVTQEMEEIAVIEEFLPRKLSSQEEAEAIKAAIAETGTSSIRDMGRVMAALKAAHTGKMDFAKASAAVKVALS